MFKKPRPQAGKFQGKPGSKFGDKKRDSRGPGGGFGGPRFFQKKVCRFCTEHIPFIDFKDNERLRKFMTEKGKIMPKRITGNCAKHQRALARSIKRARHAAVVAFQID